MSASVAAKMTLRSFSAALNGVLRFVRFQAMKFGISSREQPESRRFIFQRLGGWIFL